MKKLIPLFTFTFVLHLSILAAVHLRWTVDTSRATPATFDAYQGETLELEATLTSRGKPLELSGIAALYWQTNGMGSTYWEAAAAISSNRMYAVFTPEMDVGARVYNCFIGVPGTIYHAAFQLRLRPSPGATPNVLPLPVPVIDFAKVRVINPPWSGGGGGVDTNAVRDIAREEITPATNRLYKTLIDSKDGAARPLPKYLWLYNAYDSYPDEAQEYYRSRGNGKTDGGCSSVRDGGFLYRNFDYPFDDRTEFVVKMSAGTVPAASSPRGVDEHRYASVGVAQVGTNLTEQIVTSGKPEYSHLYKWLPGATVDGINENGVACNINVVDEDPQTSGWHNDTGDLHPLAAVRWILDNATNAQHAAEYIASHIAFPSGWTQNFHYMIADTEKTYIVENGAAYTVPSASSQTGALPAITNFRLYGDPKDTTGEGQERYIALTNGANITSQWWTLTYTANGYRASDLPGITGESLTQLFNYWENNPRESHRGETFHSGTGTGNYTWWQTVHTSVYDITNRVLSVSVQETDDWYIFQVPSSGAKIDAYTKAETDEKLAEKADKNGDAAENFNVQDLNVSGDVTIVGETRLTGGITGDVIINGGIEVGGVVAASVSDNDGNNLAEKANRADPGDNGELATLDADGNPMRSGKTAYDFADSNEFSNHVENPNAHNALAIDYYDEETYDTTTVAYEISELKSGKADRSMISSTDPIFSNAVDKIVRSLIPTTLRAYDPVRQCWWKIQPVNGVLTLTVED